MNTADNLFFQTEKQVKEYSEKLTEDDKSQLEEKLNMLKTAHIEKDLSKIDSAILELNEVWSKISTRLYQDTSITSEPVTENQQQPDVQDADFEEVK